MSIIEIANCNTTSTCRKETLPDPTFRNPFSVLTGWNDDIKNAGYNPDNNPTNTGIIKIGIRMFHCNSELKLNSRPDNLFINGKQIAVNTKEMTKAINVISTDSVRNCVTSSVLVAPLTFRIPISLARNTDLAVARFM